MVDSYKQDAYVVLDIFDTNTTLQLKTYTRSCSTV